MNFDKSKILAISDRIKQHKSTIRTEEATKTALVLPFISALDYDVFNPSEVIPEYIADIGIKKGEKIDYCIMNNGTPIILIECKHWQDSLTYHDNQLFRYFHATNVKFAILTNGITYKFFTDSEQSNKMDETPYWEFDISQMRENDFIELNKYRKNNFDEVKIFNDAIELKIYNRFINILKKELDSPSTDFVKHFARHIHNGSLTQRYLDIYSRVLSKTIKDYFAEPLGSAFPATNSVIDNQGTNQASSETIMSKSTENIELESTQFRNTNTFMIGQETITFKKSNQILVYTAEWLIRNGKITALDCPISIGKKRNLINTTPYHTDNSRFRQPKVLSNNLYIETHFSAGGCIGAAQKLLQSCGYPSGMFKV